MIYYSVPFDTSKNIGRYYNAFMEMLPHDHDFACFIDGDAVFTTPLFGAQLQDIVTNHQECGLFFAMTNRVGTSWQLAEGVNPYNNDMSYHRTVGSYMKDKYNLSCIDISDKKWISGFLILVKKQIWLEAGKFLETGMLGVDEIFFRKVKSINKPIYLMQGVYLYHWYRGGDRKNIEHLKSLPVIHL